MKTTASSPASTPKKRGNPRKKANAALARGIRREIHQARKAATASEALKLPKPLRQPKDQPRYGTGLRMDTPGLHYAVKDPTPPPVNDGGKVKLDISTKTPVELVNFAYAVNADMTDNEFYPEADQQPPATDFKALIDSFATSVTDQTSAVTAMKNATAARDALWQQVLQALGVRGAYVQQASNGNTEAILSAGFAVRNPRTPTGVLPAPGNITATPGDTSGVMNLDWEIVPKARGYNVQFADASTSERNWQLLTTSNRARFTALGLTPGSVLAFRVAANGGSTGQSVWSYEVVRTVA